MSGTAFNLVSNDASRLITPAAKAGTLYGLSVLTEGVGTTFRAMYAATNDAKPTSSAPSTNAQRYNGVIIKNPYTPYISKRHTAIRWWQVY